MINRDDGGYLSGHGIQFRNSRASEVETSKQRFWEKLTDLEIASFVQVIDRRNRSEVISQFHLSETQAKTWAPHGDTSQLCQNLGLNSQMCARDCKREIMLALLLSPVPYTFTNFDELMATIRIRQKIVGAARKTSLAFGAYEADRPEEYWTYVPDRGFILRPGQPLIAALVKATQPEMSGRRYTFSCRRAVEYVLLLAVASEIESCNAELFCRLRRQAEIRALKGHEFESVFIRQVGSPRSPLPVRFFVPGDRTWFRNPDPNSSQATGFEGSWTFYLGAGQFADFWHQNQNFDLTSKCLTIYHWRNATYRDENNELQVDERLVENLVKKTLSDPTETERILDEALRVQEPLGTYSGGFIEAHRECPCQICPGSSDLALPDVESTAFPNESVA